MPVTFWSASVILVVIALAFIIQPLLFVRHRLPANDRGVQNLATYRSRLRELEKERDDGLLDESNFEALRDELEISLLSDVDDQPQSEGALAQPVSIPGRKALVTTTLVLCLAIPVSAFYLYSRLGASDALADFRLMQPMDDAQGVSREDVRDMVEGLRERLEREPDDLRGWAMLARSYMQLERYAAAADAYRGLARAMEETGEGDPASAWGLRAQALFVGNQGRITEAVEASISEARSRNPDEINSLALRGIQAFRAQSYRDALDYWERILEIAPDHPQAESIRAGIGAAYSQLGEPVPPGALGARENEPGAASAPQ